MFCDLQHNGENLEEPFCDNPEEKYVQHRRDKLKFEDQNREGVTKPIK